MPDLRGFVGATRSEDAEAVHVDVGLMLSTGGRPLLILDLDECLIHALESELHRAADFRIGRYHVYWRPGLAEFLAAMGRYYDLAVWSSGTNDYVNEIAARIRPAELTWRFVWARERCTLRTDFDTMEPVYVKDLKKVKRLGYDINRILFVDDTPAKLARNFGNAIYVSCFEGAENDLELNRLATYLTSIANTPNFRTLEKRHWRNQ